MNRIMNAVIPARLSRGLMRAMMAKALAARNRTAVAA
jgi:hypothetical protein